MSEMTTPAGTSGSTKTYRRRAGNILIHKPMQREFTMVLIGLLIISTFAVAYVIHSTIHDVAFGEGAYHFGKISPYEVLSDISYQLVVRVSCILFVTLVITGIYGVFFLHRVAGPVYRFRQVFLRLNDGEIPHDVKLREGDFFPETAAEINRHLNKLRFESGKNQLMKQKIDQMIASRPNDALIQSAKDLKNMLNSEVRE